MTVTLKHEHGGLTTITRITNLVLDEAGVGLHDAYLEAKTRLSTAKDNLDRYLSGKCIDGWQVQEYREKSPRKKNEVIVKVYTQIDNYQDVKEALIKKETIAAIPIPSPYARLSEKMQLTLLHSKLLTDDEKRQMLGLTKELVK